MWASPHRAAAVHSRQAVPRRGAAGGRGLVQHPRGARPPGGPTGRFGRWLINQRASATAGRRRCRRGLEDGASCQQPQPLDPLPWRLQGHQAAPRPRAAPTPLGCN
ncbi:hypothetical protein EXJ73_14870 [Pelomonas aquatica]|uniref:Uncharacterized protein n=1 Tax=Pelomonas aquatica TaxID=431058 RepID=A0A9X4R8Z2_9BURK|nr:hypothetical protein [Pelomonas aquatica]